MRTRSLHLLVLFKGLTAIIAQTLIIRELWVVFEGNELTLSLMFGTWLLAGAAGSFLAGRPWFTKQPPRAVFAAGFAVLACLLPAAMLAIRGFRPLFGLYAGEILSLGQVALLCVATLALPAACDALIFVSVVRALASTRRAAMLDAAGLFAGGLLLTFILIPWVAPFATSALLALAAASVAAGFWTRANTLKTRRAAWAFPAAFLVLLFLSPRLEDWSAGLAWPHETLVDHRESRQGRLSILSDKGQVTVALNGLVVITTPDPDATAIEDFIHLPLLAVPPRGDLLFVNTAAGGMIRETLKYPVRSVTSLEPDPGLIRRLKAIEDPGLQAELNDERVHFVFKDPRPYLARTRERFDAIFVPQDFAVSLASNRVFTKEFFTEARRALTAKGILVLRAPGSLAYLDEATKRWNAILIKTLQSVFSNVTVVPGDFENIFIASETVLDMRAVPLGQNLEDFNIVGRVMSPAYLDLRLDPAASAWYQAGVHDALDAVGQNSDLKPLGLYEGLALRYARSSRRLPALFWGARNGRLLPLFVIFLAVFGFIRRGAWRPHPSVRPFYALALTTGFFAMSLQLILLFVFQCFFGSAFQTLGLFTAAFMAGTALGAQATRGRELAASRVTRLLPFDVGGPLVLVGLAGLGLALGQKNPAVSLWEKCGLLTLSAGTGYWAGMELVLVVAAVMNRLPRWMGDRARVSASVYGLDLAGACAAAIATPLYLIPAFGIAPALLVLLALKASSAWALSPFREPRAPFTPR